MFRGFLCMLYDKSTVFAGGMQVKYYNERFVYFK